MNVGNCLMWKHEVMFFRYTCCSSSMYALIILKVQNMVLIILRHVPYYNSISIVWIYLSLGNQNSGYASAHEHNNSRKQIPPSIQVPPGKKTSLFRGWVKLSADRSSNIFATCSHMDFMIFFSLIWYISKLNSRAERET